MTRGLHNLDAELERLFGNFRILRCALSKVVLLDS